MWQAVAETLSVLCGDDDDEVEVVEAASSSDHSAEPQANAQGLRSELPGRYRAQLPGLCRKMPRNYLDNTTFADALPLARRRESVILSARRRLESFPPNTAITIGMAGTNHNGHGPPAIERGRVYPNSGLYQSSRGWDAKGTEALILGFDVISDHQLRDYETQLIAIAKSLPNVVVVSESTGGEGKHTHGPARVVYLNKLNLGVDPEAVRDAQSGAKCKKGERYPCGKCGHPRAQRGYCSGEACAAERAERKKARLE